MISVDDPRIRAAVDRFVSDVLALEEENAMARVREVFSEARKAIATIPRSKSTSAQASTAGAPAAPPAKPRKASSDWSAKLSPREREVIECVAKGERHPGIAKRLGITGREVDSIRKRAARKLGAPQGRLELAEVVAGTYRPILPKAERAQYRGSAVVHRTPLTAKQLKKRLLSDAQTLRTGVRIDRLAKELGSSKVELWKLADELVADGKAEFGWDARGPVLFSGAPPRSLNIKTRGKSRRPLKR